MPYASKEVMREYQRQWTARQRAEYMAGRSCLQCGAGGPLEVDHIDPAQKVSHRIWTWSAARRNAELAKCQTLCVPCHKAKTRAQRPIPEHGTVSRYSGAQKCRCDLCRKANADRTKLNKAKKLERELSDFRDNYSPAA